MKPFSPWHFMGRGAVYEVAYAEAVRNLSEQRQVVESFRTRAGLVFSAAAITASFLGAGSFRGGDAGFAGWLALSLHMNGSYLKNREGIDQFAVLLQVASGLLTLEVILWLADIASRV